MDKKSAASYRSKKISLTKYLLGTHSKDSFISCSAADVLSATADHCSNNTEFIGDFIAYNFLDRRHIPSRNYAQLSGGDLPPEIVSYLRKLHKKLKYPRDNELRLRLNIPCSIASKDSALEYKWLFEYQKKFGNLVYSEKNRITELELLRPLSKKDEKQFLRYF